MNLFVDAAIQNIRNFYAILQVIGTVIIIFEVLFVAVQKPSNLQKHLIFMLLMIGVSFLGYLIELIAQTEQCSYIGICLGYISKPFALIAALLLLLEYANININKWLIVSVTMFFLTLSIIVITDYWRHGLYYKDWEWAPDKVGSPIRINEHGIFWYVYMVSSFLIFFGFSLVAGYEFKQSKTKQAKQMSVMLFLVVLFAFVGLCLFIFDLTNNYDTTLVGILAGSIILLIMLTKYRMFDLIATAQSNVLDRTNDGIVILDARMALAYFNKTASDILPELKVNMGRKNETLLINELDKMNQGQLIFVKDNIYELEVKEDKSKKHDLLLGKTYKFKNITEHYNKRNELNSEIKKVTSKIKNIQREALIAFADVVEARDGNTGDHVKSVSNVAYLIALQLKGNKNYPEVDDEYVKILKECAPLHDIGKIYVPDNILLKPGKLTPEEFEIMKTHTTKGYDIITKAISQIEEPIYIKMSQEIALSHHERWDGTGYPNKLKGEEIPLSARILAVADVYDALRMKRSYKEAFSKEKSINIIKEETGTHFDPNIVEVFLKIVKKL